MVILNILANIFLLVSHPFHISVAEIEFDEEAKAIEIAQKVFLDDIGEVILNPEGLPYNLTLAPDDSSAINAIERYFLDHLSIEVNDKPGSINFLGIEVEDDVLWCFMEITKVKKLRKITIESTILTSHFDDQTNIIHIKAFGETKSLRLHKHESRDQITY